MAECKCECECKRPDYAMLPVCLAVDKSMLDKDCDCMAAYLPPDNLYVSVDGDDANDGLSWETAFRTVQAAVDRTGGYLQLGKPITINVGPGEFVGTIWVDSDLHYKNLKIVGTSERPTLKGDIRATSSRLELNNLHVVAAHRGIFSDRSPAIMVVNCSFNAEGSGKNVFYTTRGGSIILSENIDVQCFNIYSVFNIILGGTLQAQKSNVAINGNVSRATVRASSNGTIFFNEDAYLSGSVTGKKYEIHTGGILYMGDNAIIPGTIAGTITTDSYRGPAI